MKKSFLLLLPIIVSLGFQDVVSAQAKKPTEKEKKELSSLIDQYSKARDTRGTTLLKTILTDDIDQLVSTGEWRTGIKSAVQGMLASSATNPGTRKLIVEKIKLLNE